MAREPNWGAFLQTLGQGLMTMQEQKKRDEQRRLDLEIGKIKKMQLLAQVDAANREAEAATINLDRLRNPEKVAQEAANAKKLMALAETEAALESLSLVAPKAMGMPTIAPYEDTMAGNVAAIRGALPAGATQEVDLGGAGKLKLTGPPTELEQAQIKATNALTTQREREPERSPTAEEIKLKVLGPGAYKRYLTETKGKTFSAENQWVLDHLWKTDPDNANKRFAEYLMSSKSNTADALSKQLLLGFTTSIFSPYAGNLDTPEGRQKMFDDINELVELFKESAGK